MKYQRAIVFLASAIVFVSANAQVSLTSSSATYSQNFDSLTTATTSQPWANNSTLAGWSLYTAAGVDITSYVGDTGSSNAGSFKSFGSAGSTDRALGGVTSGGAYFGSVTSGTAGYITLALSNDSGSALDSLNLSYTGEQWRNANLNAQGITVQYGFGSSFSAVSLWSDAGSSFNFVSPTVGNATGTALDGNLAANRVTGLGGTLSGLNWSSGDTLWLRWTYTNNTGNDHGLAIDDLSVSVAAAAPVPEPSQYALLLAGLGAVGVMVRRRSGQGGA